MKRIKMKSVIAVLLALALCFSTNVGTVYAAKKKSKVKVSSVVVKSPAGSKKTAYVAKGKKITLTTTVKTTPNKKANKKVTYKSANKKIATVSKKGVVKGKKLGTTKITVTSKKNSKKKKTIKIKVVNPVKKVTLNESKMTMAVNASNQLKATVNAPKKAFKSVKWSSSNTKVATVTESGFVSAIGEGEAKITVKTLDGSGKKAECIVSVRNGIKNIDIYNPQKMNESVAFKVTLHAPMVLTEKNFNVAVRYGDEGSYNKKLVVEKVLTTDNINYTVYTQESVHIGEYIQISIPVLKGTKILEKQFLSDGSADNICVKGMVGNRIDEYIEFSNAIGYVNTRIVSGSLPKGLSIDPYDNCHIIGEAQAIANNQRVTFAATDELGKVSTTTVNFIIGDENTIVAEDLVIGNDTNEMILPYTFIVKYIHIVGGSGKYNVKMLDNCNGKFYWSNFGGGYIRDSISLHSSKMNLASGKYTVKVQVTDVEDETRTAIGTLTCVVANAIPVTIIVKNYYEADHLNFYNHDIARTIPFEDDHDNYDFTENMTTYDEVNKVYTAKVYLPAGNYSIYTNSYGHIITLDKYVNITKPKTLSYTMEKRMSISGKIYDANGEQYKDSIYVRVYDNPDAKELQYYASERYNGYSEASSSETNGKYILQGLLVGTYYLRIYENHEIIGSATVTVNGANVTQDIKLNVLNSTE